jgi:D-glycero-D-manno-heptose 1,7-bisphosphate phosphatase
MKESEPCECSSSKTKALFLDRDGVINEDTEYAHLPEHIEFRPGIFDLCKSARKRGFLVLVVTNQSGIARGYFNEEDVIQLHSWMKEQFRSRETDIDDFFYCPYHEKGSIPRYTKKSDCRKPEPGMILKAAIKWNIDLDKSIMIGDKPSDRIKLPAIKSFIIKSRYTPTGYDFESLDEVRLFLERTARNPQ